MSDPTQLEHALRTLAETGGEPDEDRAWEAIRRRMTEAAEVDRRRRWLTLAATAAIGAAAAGLVVLATRPSTDQAVDVGPAAPADRGDVHSQIGTPLEAPEDPAVVTSWEGKMLNVMDPDSGAHYLTPINGLPEDERITSAAITPAGDIYLTLQIAEASILAKTHQDRSGEHEVIQFGTTSFREGGGHRSVAVDPTGTRLAFGLSGVLTPDVDPFGQEPEDWVPAIGIVDLRTNEYRELRWPAGDPRAIYTEAQQLSFSSDGSRLAFVNVSDTDATELFEAYVLDVATATSLTDARLVGDDVADVVFGPDGRLHGLVGDHGELVAVVLEGGGATLGTVDRMQELASTSRGAVLARIEDRWFRHVAGEKWTATGWDGWHD